MLTQKGNTSPYIVIGIVIVLVLIVLVLLTNQHNTGFSSSSPLPTSGSEVPNTN